MDTSKKGMGKIGEIHPERKPDEDRPVWDENVSLPGTGNVLLFGIDRAFEVSLSKRRYEKIEAKLKEMRTKRKTSRI